MQMNVHTSKSKSRKWVIWYPWGKFIIITMTSQWVWVMASQIISLTIVYSTVHSGPDQRKHQSSASLRFVRAILRWPVNFPHQGPVMRKMFPSDDVIMYHKDKKYKARCLNVVQMVQFSLLYTLRQEANVWVISSHGDASLQVCGHYKINHYYVQGTGGYNYSSIP